MRSTRFLTTTVVGLAAFGAACADAPTMAPPARLIAPAASAAVIASANGTPMVEQFKVCKVGSSASFSYSVDYVSTSIVDETGAVTLQDGECVSIAQVGGNGANVTVTETAPQAGYRLDHVEVATISAASCTGGSTSTTTIAGPIASGLIKGSAGGTNCLGITATFYNEEIPVGKIGDFVWRDDNNNGIQDAGEPGIQGVQVTLGGAASATTTTDANGKYLFTDLAAGDYTVTVGSASAGYAASPANQGSDDTIDSDGTAAVNVNLSTNSSVDLTIDFGFVPPTGAIGDFVWRDDNGNGIQDAGEPGIAGVTVTLGGAASATTSTDANGKYLFTGLTAGKYTVAMSCPAGYEATPSNSGPDDALDSESSPASVDLSANNSTDYTIDFGCVPPGGKIGDFVWEDLNGNGIQDAGEPGLQGIVVKIGGAVSATTTTDVNGFYLFTGLPAGNYTVQVGAGPSTYTASPANSGSDDARDSDGTGVVGVTLATNSSVDLTVDFGFVPPPPKAGGCTRTIGYWKTHASSSRRSKDMVTQYLPIWLGAANGTKSVKVTTASQAVNILSMQGGASNGIVKLMAQLLAAKLNNASGASTLKVDATIAAADAFLAQYKSSAWSGLSSSQKTTVLQWMATLDNYNNGKFGPKHCGC